MTFLVVYILEAHPSDVGQMESNIHDQVVFASLRMKPSARPWRGLVCGNWGLSFAVLMSSVTALSVLILAGRPVYLIDASGRVVFKSRPGRRA